MPFKYIKAAQFFPDYAPEVVNWKHKLRGIDGNKKPITFSTQDIKFIKAGIKKLTTDLKGSVIDQQLTDITTKKKK